MHTELFSKLKKIEALAEGGKLRRLLHEPLRYLSAIGYWRLVYPLRKRGRFAKARTFFGETMQVVLPSATEIYLWGAKTHDSELRLAKFLMKNLRSGDVFVDVGAHFGYFTLLASKLVGEAGWVHAFEASRSTFGILQKNTARQANITLHHRAASDSEAVLTFHEFPALFSEYNSLVLPEGQQAGWMKKNPATRIEVPGVRLADFFRNENVEPKIVKIDVEGAEPQVLQGMEHFLENHSPTLVMEYLMGSSQSQAHRWAVIFAQQFGYQVFTIQHDGGLKRCHDVEKYMVKAGLNSENVVLMKP